MELADIERHSFFGYFLGLGGVDSVVADMTTGETGTESEHQAALFKWADFAAANYPELHWLHHIPNGATLGSTARDRAIRGSRLKAQGVKPGVADVFLPVARGGYTGLYIELKKPSVKPKRPTSRGGLSDEQLDFGCFVTNQGFLWCACYGWQDAVTAIENYIKKR